MTTTRTHSRCARVAAATAIAAIMCVAPAAVTSAADSDGSNYVNTTAPGQRSITVAASSPTCIQNAPYIQYTVTPNSSTLGQVTGTIEILDDNGAVIATHDLTQLSGTLPYPGTSTVNGVTTVPGWKTAPDGRWIRDPEHENWARGLQIRVTLDGLTATGPVVYTTSADCGTPGAGGVGGSENPQGARIPGQLPDTGAGSTTAIVSVAGLTVAAGGIVLLASRRRSTAA